MPRQFHLSRTLSPPQVTAAFLSELEDTLRAAAGEIGSPIETVELEIEDAEGTETFDTADDELVEVRIPHATNVSISLEGRGDLSIEMVFDGASSGLSVEVKTAGQRAREDALMLFGRINILVSANVSDLSTPNKTRYSIGTLVFPSLRLTPAVTRALSDHMVEKVARFAGVSNGLVDLDLTVEGQGGHLKRTLTTSELKSPRLPDDVHELKIKADYEGLQKAASIELSLGKSREDTNILLVAAGDEAEAFALEAHRSVLRVASQHRSANGYFHPPEYVGAIQFIVFFVSFLDT